MRPIRRGTSPFKMNFDPYTDAQPYLISRIGMYCSYCERRICTQLAVEHIQPKKGSHAHPDLIGVWENYLLACVNCNSTKKDKKVILNDVLLPDRDNTFLAFSYSKDGHVSPSETAIFMGLEKKAKHTLELTGLDKKKKYNVLDQNEIQISVDRPTQRLNVWAIAEESKNTIDECPIDSVKRMATNLAVESGFFSIWLAVFEADTDMCNRLIDAFNGTRNSGCFDSNAIPISPAPNPDNLHFGGKI